MKKYLGALLAGGMVFALVMGSAAALNFGDVAPLQVGATAPGALECDDSVDVRVRFPEHGNVATDGHPYDSERASDGVIVSDIDANCMGAWLTAIAEDDAGNELIRRSPVRITSDVMDVRWDDEEAVDPMLIESIELHVNG